MKVEVVKRFVLFDFNNQSIVLASMGDIAESRSGICPYGNKGAVYCWYSFSSWPAMTSLWISLVPS